MKAAVVVAAGQNPVYSDFKEPVASPGTVRIRVKASALSHLTRMRAAGAHYSAEAAPPFVPGVDGVGVRDDGQRVYFLMPDHPFGAMAQYSVVSEHQQFPLPHGLSDETAAAMAIPGMSSWAALTERAHLRAGETVLVNGATGSSGRLAIQIARHLGAGKVIATGRQTHRFDELVRLGADTTIALSADRQALERALGEAFAQGVDVILDYVYGPSAEALVTQAARHATAGRAVRFVQIGSIAGADITLPAAALRSSGLVMMGSGLGSVPLPKLRGAIERMLHAAPAAGFAMTSAAMPLSEVAHAWTLNDSEARVVLTP